ncbi:MAG: hypothetical protein WC262_10200, partial [Bacteroidales bacterium]
MTKNSDVSWIPKSVGCSLKRFTTADLVAELSKRDGVIVPHPDLWFGTINNEIKCGKPPKILVV